MGLKEFRQDNDLTQQEVADYLGLKKSFISAIERGGRPLPPKHMDALMDNDRGWEPSSLRISGSKNVAVAVGGSRADVCNNSAQVDLLQKEVDLLRRHNEQLHETISYLTRNFDVVREDYRGIIADFKAELLSAKEQYRRVSENYIRLVELKDARMNSGGNTDVNIKM